MGGKNIVINPLVTGIYLLGLIVFFYPVTVSHPYYYFVERDYAVRMLVSLLAMTLACSEAASDHRIKLSTGHILLFLLTVSGALSMIHAADRALSIFRLDLYLCWFFLTVACSRVFVDRLAVTSYARWISLITILVCVMGLYEKFSGKHIVNYPEASGHISSLVEYPTVYGGYLLSLLFPIQAALSVTRDRGSRLLFGIALILLFLNLYYCRSVAAIAVSLCFEAYVLLTHMKKIGAKKCVVAAVSVFSAIVALAAVTYVVSGHYPSLAELVADKRESFQMRIDGWIVMSHMIRDRPWLGFGPDQFGVFFPYYRAKYHLFGCPWLVSSVWFIPTNPENIVMLFLAEQGVLGLLMFTGVMAWTIAGAFFGTAILPEWKRRVLAYQGCGVIGLLFYSMFHMLFLSPCVWPLIWINVSMIWALRRDKNEETRWESPEKAQKTGPAKRLLLVPLLILLSIYMFYLPLGSWVNDVKADRGKYFAMNGDKSRFLREYRGMLPGIPRSAKYYTDFGDSLGVFSRRKAIVQLKKAERLSPYDTTIMTKIMLALRVCRCATRKEIATYRRKIDAIGFNKDWPRKR